MQKRHIVYNIQGMGLDVVSSPLNTTMAYSIKNMRLTPTKNSNALELTTERGTKPIYIEEDNFPTNVKILGYCILLQYLVLFLKGEKIFDNYNNWIGGPDYIYRLEQQDNDTYISKCLFEGDLNFDEDSTIEATSYYENTDVLKIYWVDGVNQPRVINIINDYGSYFGGVYTKFDFLQEVFYNTSSNIPSSARIKAKKLYTGGNFTSGVIQYAYSLYSMNSLETPLLDITSLNYITHHDRGGAPNEQCGCSFEITIENKNLKNKFDYIRVYSIQRNSLNGTPLARVVADVHFDEEITIIDDGNGGYDIDYNQLQYQRLPIHPLTLTLKDNVLFVGNYDIDKSTENMTPLYLFGIQIDTENWWPYGSNWDDHYGVEVYDPNDVSVYPWKNQLDTESAGVKTFKYGETYKLGVQFQDKYGNWSQPYFIKDVKQDKYPIINNGKLLKPIFTCYIDDITSKLYQWEKDLYVRIRPVVSFPSLTERSVLCQGVLNPTVFNLTERIDKTCYALSSWFFRNQVNNDIYLNTTYSDNNGAINESKHYYSLLSSDNIGSEIQGMFFDDDLHNGNHSKDPSINTNKYGLSIDTFDYDLAPDSLKPYTRPYKTADNIDDIYTELYRNYYFIDNSILTYNSPNIEFNSLYTDLNNINCDINIIGYINCNANSGYYNIISQNPTFLLSATDAYGLHIRNANDMAYGFVNNPIINLCNTQNILNICGILSSQTCWIDGDAQRVRESGNNPYDTLDLNFLYDGNVSVIPYKLGWNSKSLLFAYMVYPWQRQYLNNYVFSSDIENAIDSESSKITNKILANLRYSLNTNYINNTYNLQFNDIHIVNNDNGYLLMDNNKLYCSSYNKYLNYNSKYISLLYSALHPNSWQGNIFGKMSGYPIMIDAMILLKLDQAPTDDSNYENFVIKYPSSYNEFINQSLVIPYEVFESSTTIYSKRFLNIPDILYTVSPRDIKLDYYGNSRSNDSILISYKSSKHAVLLLDTILFNNNTYQVTLPKIDNNNYDEYRAYHRALPWVINNNSYDSNIYGYTTHYIGYSKDPSPYIIVANINKPISQSYLNTWNTSNPNHPYLENESNLYLRNWLPAGKAQQLPLYTGSGVKVSWIEGDTYYQRYDCVKTKPYSDESYQSVIEILSFMVESNINLDGRYDKNRGILDYTIISDDNFNLFNDVYNQENNFFTYHILDPAKFNIEEFRNDIIWSAKKISGENVDQWTKLSSVNQLQLDGNKGYVKALRKFNDNIYCFQDHAISRIRFNDRTAISTEQGIPLLLAYTNYVDGYEYVNSDIGCQYGISCCETENGIFFIDNDIPGIYKMSYNEYGNINVRSLTKERMMQRWFENDGNVKKTRVFFDKPVNEILTVCNKDIDYDIDGYCISFSCDMNSFQLFIDYNRAKYIFSHNNWPIAITDTNGQLELWKLRSGSFVSFFGQYRKPYGLEIIASPPRTNDGLVLDCIYDSLSYKADVFVGPNGDFDPGTYQPDESFDKLEVSSIYLTSDTSYLEYTNQPTHQISNLRKKFGSWFARIPRFNDISQTQGRYNRERMRGSKLKINLMKGRPKITNHKLILKELSVDCFY